MVSQGILRVAGESYTVYALDAKGSTRLDITERGARFQVDVDQVVYSHYGKIKKYRKGNRAVFEAYKDIKQRLDRAPGKTNVTSEWIDGAYVETITKEISPNQVVVQKKENGVLASYTYTDGEDYLTVQVTDAVSEYFVEPIDKQDYEKTLLDKVASAANSAVEYLSYAVLRATKDLDWIDTVDYEVVDTMERFNECIQLWRDYDDDEETGFDFETNTLDVFIYGELIVAGLVISPWEGTSWYFPFHHETFDNLPYELMFTTIFELCQKKSLVAHNKKYERKVILKIAMDALLADPNFDYQNFVSKFKIQKDSLILEFLINPILVKGSHSLKELGANLRNRFYLELKDIFKDKKSIHFPALDKETVRIYACPDADNCRAIQERRWGDLPTYTRRLYKEECDLADLKAAQEFWGVRVNKEGLETQKFAMKKDIDKLEAVIHKLAKSDIKLTSGPQLSELLYQKMNCPVFVRTKTQQPSTSSAALKKLGGTKLQEPIKTLAQDIPGYDGKPLLKADELNMCKYPLVKMIEKHRELNKLYTAFFERITTRAINGRYGFWINQNGTASGRQASPIHQLPKPAKRYILPDSDDHILVDADYSCIELRLTACMAGETELIKLCCDPNNDMHRIIDQLITGTEMWAISSEMRQFGKRRNFGTVYGISGRGLAAQIYGAKPTDEQIKTCEKSLLSFYTTFKHIYLMVQKNRESILETGKIHTRFGRTRYFPQIFDPTYPEDKKKALLRQGNNTPMQGTAADIMKIAENNITEACARLGWDRLIDTPQGKFPMFRVMLSAHDEVLCSAHKSIPQWKILAVLKQCMELQIKDFCPLFTGVCFVDNWEEGKADEYQIPVVLRDRFIKEQNLHFTEDIKNQICKIINDYRDGEIKAYMESLIAETQSTDAEVVWQKVRHPQLTHDLIARFPSTYGTSHIDAIKNATEKYLKHREDPNFVDVVSTHVDDNEDTATIRDELLSNSVEALFNYDAEGNIVTDDYDSDELFEDEDYEYGGFSNIEDTFLPMEEVYIWEFLNHTVIDAAGLTLQDVDELISLIWEFDKPDAYSKVFIQFNGESLDSQVKCDRIDKQRILEFLEAKKRVNIRR